MMVRPYPEVARPKAATLDKIAVRSFFISDNS
jgi:hypothetical protein